MKKLNAQQYNAIKEGLKMFGNEIAIKTELNALQGNGEPYKIPEDIINYYMQYIERWVVAFANEE